MPHETSVIDDVTGRSGRRVGVVSDGQGLAAGVEVPLDQGAHLDLAALCRGAAADPCGLSAVQLRLVVSAPAANGRNRSAAICRAQVLLRFEPLWAADVVAAHGGGARAGRLALAAAIERLAARVRAAGVGCAPLTAAELRAQLHDVPADRPFTRAYGGRIDDLSQLAEVLCREAPETAVLSVCVRLRSTRRWDVHLDLVVATASEPHAAAVEAALLVDGLAIERRTVEQTLGSVLPLGGGPADLVSVLTLARG